MNIQDKAVIITDGSSGIGKATAIELVKRGANVVINGRREQALVEAANEIDPTGAHVAYIAGDISDPQIAERLIGEALSRFGAVAPGITKTPMHSVETHDYLAQLHPVGRMGETQDIVDAIVYLESAQFVTGEILHVDGGQNAGQW